MRRVIFLITIALIGFAIACGGGGGGTTPTATPSVSISPSVSPSTSPTTSPTPTPTPAAKGTLLGKVYDYNNVTWLSGATVKNAVGDVIATTDAQGKINADVNVGSYALTITAPNHNPGAASCTITAGQITDIGIIYLFNGGSASGVIGAGNTVLTVSDVLEITIEPGVFGVGTQVSAYYIPGQTEAFLMPGRLPSELGILGGFHLIATPVSGKIDRAAGIMTVKMKNSASLPANMSVPIGKLDKPTNIWNDSGMGNVTTDGNWIQMTTTSDGIYAAGLPAVADEAVKRVFASVSLSGGNFLSGEPHVDITDGNLKIGIDTPVLKGFGIESFLTLFYETNTVRTQRMLELLITQRDPADTAASYGQISFGAFEQKFDAMLTDTGDAFFARTMVDTSVTEEGGDKTMRPSGVYPYEVRFGAYYNAVLAESKNGSFKNPEPGATTALPAGPVPFNTNNGRALALFNNMGSPFGNGWYVGGLERLYFNADFTAAAVIGRRNGNSLVFEPSGEYMADNYQYLLNKDIPDTNLPFAVCPTHVVAVDGEWVYIGVTNKTNYADPATVSYYKLKDPMASLPPGSAILAEPVEGTEKELVATHPLGRRTGDPFAVHPITHEIYIYYQGKVKRFSGSTWYDVADTTVLEGMPEGEGDICFNAAGDMYFIGWRNVFFIPNGGTVATSILWLPNQIGSLALDSTGNFYICDKEVGDLRRCYIDDGGITQFDIIGSFIGERDVVAGDYFPIADAELHAVYDIAVNADDEVFLLTDRSIYKVDGQDYISLVATGSISNEPEDKQLNKELVSAMIAGFSDAQHMVCGPGGMLYLGGPYRQNSQRLILKTNGLWKCSNDETATLERVDDTYVVTDMDGIKSTFDVDGYLTSIDFLNGKSATLTYAMVNGVKQIAKYEIEGVGYWTFTFPGGQVNITDSLGRSTVLQKNAFGYLESVTTPGSATSNFQYNAEGLMSKRTMPNVATPTGAVRNVIDYTYDDKGFVRTIKYNGSHTQTITEDGLSSLINEYAGTGLATSMATPANEVTAKFEADNEPDITFKRLGLNIETEQNGKSIVKEFDKNGRLVKATFPDGKVNEYEYHELSGKTRYVKSTSRGEVWKVEYNEDGRISMITNPIDKQRFYSYDEQGRVDNFFDSNGMVAYTYAAETGLPTGQKRDGLTEYTATYDGSGRMTRLNGSGHDRTYAYDTAGNIITVTEGASVSEYTYNSAGYITGMTTGDRSLSFEISPQHNSRLIGGYVPAFVITKVIKATGDINLLYDMFYNGTDFASGDGDYVADVETNGLPSKMTFPDGSYVDYTFDDSGKCTAKTYTVGGSYAGTINIAYNSIGMMTSTQNALMTNYFEYDSNNTLARLSSVAKLPADAASDHAFVYNISGDRVLNMQYDTGSDNLYSYTYTGFDMLLSRIEMMPAGVGAGEIVAEIGYNKHSKITSVKNTPAGIDIAYARDEAGRMTAASGPVDFFATYIDGMATGFNNGTFGDAIVQYDTGGRLASVIYGGASAVYNEAYTYDANDNRTSSHLRGTAVYANDRLASDDEFTYSYDSAMRMIQATPKGIDYLRQYAYDYQGNLIEVKIYNGNTVGSGVKTTYTYRYNALGLCYYRGDGAIDTFYYYDTRERLIAMADNAGIFAEFQYADETAWPVSMWTGGKTYLYIMDAFHNIIGLTDGTTTYTYLYDSYGNTITDSGLADNPFRFATAIFDDGTGLYYMKHRWYDPMIGRFLTPDPNIYNNGYNMYVYAKGNPFRYFDPTGHEDEEEWDGRIEFNDPYDYIGNEENTGSPAPPSESSTVRQDVELENRRDHGKTALKDVAEMGGEQLIQEGVKYGIKKGVAKYGEKLLSVAPRLMGLGGRAVPFLNIFLIGKDILDVGAFAYGQYEYYRIAPKE